jgi:hypothetical protein
MRQVRHSHPRLGPEQLPPVRPSRRFGSVPARSQRLVLALWGSRQRTGVSSPQWGAEDRRPSAHRGAGCAVGIGAVSHHVPPHMPLHEMALRQAARVRSRLIQRSAFSEYSEAPQASAGRATKMRRLLPRETARGSSPPRASLRPSHNRSNRHGRTSASGRCAAAPRVRRSFSTLDRRRRARGSLRL